MPEIDIDSVAKEYYETVKDKYPKLDLEKFTKICKNPFHFITNQMGRGDIPTILVKFLGKFRVFELTVLQRIKENKKKFDNGSIDEELYLKNKLGLEGKLPYIDKEEDEEEEITKVNFNIVD